MGFYPVSLELTERCCVVVGGGIVAQRRVEALLEAGAAVTVVSPAVTAALAELIAAGRVRHIARTYSPGDLAGATLAFAATDDATVTPALAREARPHTRAARVPRRRPGDRVDDAGRAGGGGPSRAAHGRPRRRRRGLAARAGRRRPRAAGRGPRGRRA